MFGLVVFLVSLSGFSMFNFQPEATNEFTPRGSVEEYNKNLVETYFPVEMYIISIYFYGKGYTDILSANAFLNIQSVYNSIENFTSSDGIDRSFNCVKNPNNTAHCLEDESGPLYYYYNNGTYSYSSADSFSTLLTVLNSGQNQYTSSIHLATDSIFKATTPATLTFTTTYNMTGAIGTRYNLMMDSATAQSTKFKNYEIELRKQLMTTAFEYIDVGYVSVNTLNYDVESAAINDMMFLALGIVLLICYSFFVVGRYDKVNARILLTGSGLLGILFSIVECFLYGSFSGFNITAFHNLLNFLIIGIGYDDIYVVTRGYDNERAKYLLKQRNKKANIDEVIQELMGETLAKNGISITVSSITSLLSFMTGVFSTIPFVQSFSMYAGFAIFFLWLNTLLIYVPNLVWHSRSSLRNQVDCFGYCFFPDYIENGVIMNYNASLNNRGKDDFLSDHENGNENGDEDKHVEHNIQMQPDKEMSSINVHIHNSKNKTIVDEDSLEETKNVPHHANGINKNNPSNSNSNSKTFESKLVPVFEALYENAIKPRYCKMFIMLVAMLLLAGSILGMSKVEHNAEYILFLPKDSYSYTSVSAYENILADGKVMYIYSIGIEDYTSFYTQQSFKNISEYILAAAADPDNDNDFYRGDLQNWYTTLYDFVEAGSCVVAASPVTLVEDFIPPDHFYACLTQLTAINPNVSQVLRMNNSVIYTSVMSFFSRKLETKEIPAFSEFCYTAASLLPRIGDSYNFPMNNQFKTFYGVEKVLDAELLKFLLTASACIMGVVYLIFNDLVAMVLLSVNITSIILMIYSSIYYLGLYLNTPVLIFLIMSLGVSVDYSAHIIHSFIGTRGSNETRVKQALMSIGSAVFHAAASTFLGILFTYLGQNYIWEAFSRIWTTIVLSGALYSLLVLPIVLTLVGPAHQPDASESRGSDSTGAGNGTDNSDNDDFYVLDAMEDDFLTAEEKAVVFDIYSKYKIIRSSLKKTMFLKTAMEYEDTFMESVLLRDLVTDLRELRYDFNIDLGSNLYKDYLLKIGNRVKMTVVARNGEGDGSPDQELNSYNAKSSTMKQSLKRTLNHTAKMDQENTEFKGSLKHGNKSNAKPKINGNYDELKGKESLENRRNIDIDKIKDKIKDNVSPTKGRILLKNDNLSSGSNRNGNGPQLKNSVHATAETKNLVKSGIKKTLKDSRDSRESQDRERVQPDKPPSKISILKKLNNK